LKQIITMSSGGGGVPLTTTMMAVTVSSLLLLLGAGSAAVSYNDSSLMQMPMQWGSARATWYGQPNGAGPYDNGTYVCVYVYIYKSRDCILLLLLP
jgi:hypothetical protein